MAHKDVHKDTDSSVPPEPWVRDVDMQGESSAHRQVRYYNSERFEGDGQSPHYLYPTDTQGVFKDNRDALYDFRPQSPEVEAVTPVRAARVSGVHT